MNYNEFVLILNNAVFGQLKSKLLEKIAESPERFVGLFRPTSPKAKIVQNLLHSGESKFGNALEELMRLYLEEHGCESLERNIRIGGERKNLDLYFRKDGVVYFAELKMRDDHDNSKAAGQFNDFDAKLQKISEIHGVDNVHGMMFFVDPGLTKHQRVYEKKLAALRANRGVIASLVYGGQFFDAVLHRSGIWQEIESHLEHWRKSVPDFPVFNFDTTPEKSFEEIKDLRPGIFWKLFANEEIGKHILPILFPERKTLKILADYWAHKPGGADISRLMRERIAEMESNSAGINR